jgi:serine/threonine protein kinase
MGEVYRAKDTRLDRDVAIKVLPQQLSRNLEFKQRFEREARSISQLTHAHICTLHDVGHHDGTDYLVMELLEGETVAQRVAKGPLPLDAVLTLGVEIASALDAAHRKGVVHRDLKPGNVMLTKAGAKLLDFGLAKSASVMESNPSALTVSQPLTGKGTILGTFQYMAPEQLEGAEADSRTDIFAFGAVLYEMATGKRAFEGHSRASLIASIMSSHPRPISELQAMTPPALDRLVRKCLAKDPDARWQSAADVADELRWITESGSETGAPIAVIARRRRREGLAWTIVGLCTVALITLTWITFRLPSDAPRVIRASILPPEGTALSSIANHPGPVIISPDGTRLAFVARRSEGSTHLWVRSLDSHEAKALPDTEGATRAFWSADSRFLGFFADHKLKKVDASGGPPFTLADAPDSRGGTWNREGVIVFAPNWTGPLYRVSANGGEVIPATKIDVQRQQSTHRYPYFLPDGNHFVFLVRRVSAGIGEEPAIMVGSLDSMDGVTVVHTASNVAFASGHLLFVRQGTLMAQPFDVDRIQTAGEAFPIVKNLLMDERFSLGVFSASQNGLLAYQTGVASTSAQLHWVDRSGKRLEPVGSRENYYFDSCARLSPDGTRIVISIMDLETGLSDIWLHDLGRGLRTRFSFERADSTNAVWSPDGTRVLFSAFRGPQTDFIIKAATGAGAQETVSSLPDIWAEPLSWSSDGRFVLIQPQSTELNLGLWLLPLEGDRTPRPFLDTQADETMGLFSPDGRFVTYVSNTSGRNEVYVVPFPDPGGQWQVSTQGGTEPRWRSDGKELYYFTPDNWLIAAQVNMEGDHFEIGGIQQLFQARESGDIWRYDVAQDGERFLVLAPLIDEAASPIHLVVNWPEELKRK